MAEIASVYLDCNKDAAAAAAIAAASPAASVSHVNVNDQTDAGDADDDDYAADADADAATGERRPSRHGAAATGILAPAATPEEEAS